jgi:hypothetical protein
MKKILLEALIYPVIIFLLCLGIGIPLVFIGFQTLSMTGTRSASDIVSYQITRKHYFGLYTIKLDVARAKGAHIIKRKGLRGFMESGAYLITSGKDVPLLLGAGKSDSRVKKNVVESVNNFLDDRAAKNCSNIFHISNVYGFIGLPFLVFGLLGILGWPSAIASGVKKLKAS